MGEPFQRVGIVGTGEIGRRMGSLLRRAGYQVAGYDTSPRAMEAAAASGVEPCQDIGELCSRSDLVITCVTDGAALRKVACGPGGLEMLLAEDVPVVDTTSAEPWVSRDVAAVLAKRGIPFLDAPVSGGVPAADSGRMNFMVGGDAVLLDRIRPLLRHLGPVVMHVGAVGDGHTIKAVNMLALASSMLATAELIAIGAGMGGDPARLVAELDAGIGASYSTRVHYPRFILPGNFSSGFTFDLMLKDLSIAIELANRLDVPLFLQRSAFEIYRSAAHSGLRGKDNTRIVEFRLPAASREVGAIDAAAFELVAAGFNLAIAAEAIALGSAAGLAPRTIIDVISAGSGDSHALSHMARPYLFDAKLSGVRLGAIAEAHGMLLASALRERVPATLVFQSFSVQVSAMQALGGGADASCLFDIAGRRTGQAKRLHQDART